ncbi:CHAT domain-containing protein [Vibrio alginolyticus]|uniref:CHAT domain-containing protein n=1 Tax=Vibrio alginolyticus TaxID=663 RepID=UPI001EEDCD6F|nr:CHAT domain-containing protein [Vibrio alginolyticus]ELB2766023.1 CHAT domain-containing protein [Vibrio alginolyticus]ULF98672.1 CHAT domain-containing protein [Vibrio alginolyticus]
MGSFSIQTEQAIAYSAMQDLHLRSRVKIKWFELTETAKSLLETKDATSILKAEKLLSKALKVALKEPLARASTCHDLGVLHFTYHIELPGGTYHNLNKAIQYFNRAIDTPQRRSTPEKYASSLSQLAVTYRRAAHEYLWPDKDINCLEKAKLLHGQAIDTLQSSEVPQAIKDGQLSIIYFNLASVLFDQGLNQSACELQSLSVALYLDYQNYHLPTFMSIMAPEQALGLSYARLMHFSDSQHHKELCKTILDIAPQFGIDPLKIMSINPTVDLSKPELQVDYLVSNTLSNPNRENIGSLVRKQFELMDNRRFCKSDPEADYLASLAQRICSGLARVLVKENDALNALRYLENCSALRFCESANKHWQQPSTKLAGTLWNELLQLGASYHTLNELALMLEHVQEKELQPLIQACYESSQQASMLEELTLNTVFYNASKLPEVVSGALDNKDPIDYLRIQANYCFEDFQKLENLIYQLEPSFVEYRGSDSAIDISHFKKALRTHDDLTLVRIDIESGFDDALILVAKLVNGEIVVKGHIVEVPNGLVNHIAEFIRGDSDADEHWPLDFVDWSEILPNDCKRVGLLTSFFASQIPWVATGIKGKELYTLVEEVNCLPTVLYLCNHVTHFNKRSGAKCINGGETRFHNVANQHVPDLMSNVSKSDFVDAVRSSEVLSYYGHCAHEFPNRPSLKTKHFDLHDLELVNQVAGMERVEFWACQSGSNIPLSVFSIPVNEAFGFDMRMIEWGAASSIGSLWALPDIVTAHIKSHYDQLVINGSSPSKALLAAQNWWVSQGAKAELNKMRELGLSPYLNTLGCNESLDGLLGPMKTKESRNEGELKQAERLFLHPSSWAGLRFCGVEDQINRAVCKEQVELKADEMNSLKNHLAQQQLKSGFINYA